MDTDRIRRKSFCIAADTKIERGLILPSPDKMIDFIRLLGISVYVPPEKLEEKVVTNEISDTKDCKIFEIAGQYVVLTNSTYLNEENVLKKFVKQNCVEVLTIDSILMMNDIICLFHSDADVCKFAAIVEKKTKISKTAKTLLVALISYLYHYCSHEMLNINTVMKLMRVADINENDSTDINKLNWLFNSLEKEEPNSFAIKQYKAFKMESAYMQKHSIIEINDLFKEIEACIESKEEKNWQNTASYDLYHYLKNDEIENKIISVDMEQNKMYGKIIYKYLKYMFKKSRFDVYFDEPFDEMKKGEAVKSEATLSEKEIINLPKTQIPYFRFGENEDSLMETSDENWGLADLEFQKE